MAINKNIITTHNINILHSQRLGKRLRNDNIENCCSHPPLKRRRIIKEFNYRKLFSLVGLLLGYYIVYTVYNYSNNFESDNIIGINIIDTNITKEYEGFDWGICYFGNNTI